MESVMLSGLLGKPLRVALPRVSCGHSAIPSRACRQSRQRSSEHVSLHWLKAKLHSADTNKRGTAVPISATRSFALWLIVHQSRLAMSRACAEESTRRLMNGGLFEMAERMASPKSRQRNALGPA